MAYSVNDGNGSQPLPLMVTGLEGAASGTGQHDDEWRKSIISITRAKQHDKERKLFSVSPPDPALIAGKVWAVSYRFDTPALIPIKNC